MGLDSAGYKVLLLLHILTAIFGFGAVVLNGLYASEVKKRPGLDGLAVFDANFKVTMIGEKLIYLVPLFGLGLVAMSDDVWKFSQTWVISALVLFVFAIGLSHGALIPAAKKQRELMTATPPDPALLEANGKKLAMFGGILNVMLVAMLFLMIWKPGL